MYTDKVSLFFETGNSDGKHKRYMLVIFDISNNLTIEARFVFKACNLSILLNIDTRTLCMCKSILNLTLEQI